MRKIYILTDNERKNSVKVFLETAQPKTKKKFEFMKAYLEDEKNILCEPYIKHFGTERYKELYEIRLRSARTMVRIIFYMADNNVILLHAFQKRDRKDTENALEFTVKLLNEQKAKALNPMENLEEI
ncbi:MAG: type II toxin-antitoxin system RelE/ParE family toxin [Firmicutes bacterium]|nr:type II toxin-antitoxin system RelE/ParE family toxin [Bacillota bacterium]